MREAGYYTTNWKNDYNIAGDNWHDSRKGKAHWRNRKDKSQPFFSKFDFNESHSSVTSVPDNLVVKQRLNRLKKDDFHDPAKAPVPPFHPDTATFRKTWARYYDAVTQVDYRAGEIFQQLKDDGEWENTIIIIWADHGAGMPRGKFRVSEQGTHVPLIVRYPEKYQHLAPAKPGTVIDDMISLMDMGPSVLKIAGIETPAYMHGRALLSKSNAKKRDYVVSSRDRLDSRFEMVRSIRDKRYRYQRNFYPHLPYAPFENFQFKAPVYKEWAELARKGKLNKDQQEFALRFKPVELLFDSENDPHMMTNIANDPAYKDVLKLMRKRLYDWQVETIDLGILEESELHHRAKSKPAHWNVGQSINNYESILKAANLIINGQSKLNEIKEASIHADPAIRFWGVLGLNVVTQSAGPETVEGILPILKKALADNSISVRLTAAEGLCNLGYYKDAAEVLAKALTDPQISAASVLHVFWILSHQKLTKICK